MKAMHTDWAVISREKAAEIIAEQHVTALIEVENCGADVNMLLGNGQTLSYWAPGDASPEDWWLWLEEADAS